METNHNLSALLEAVLFSQGQPVATQFLANIAKQSAEQTTIALLELQKKYESPESGIALLRADDRWVLATKATYAAYIAQALELSRQVPLSKAAMEVLSIIAYKQPISRGYIDQIRGVDSAHLVHTLIEKSLVEEAGRLDVPGRPIIYRTTDLFLRSFQLSSLDELPTLGEEYEQLAFSEAEETAEGTADPFADVE